MRDQDATVLVNFNREEEMARLLEQAYSELGKAYYEGGFEDPLPQLLPLFERITNLKNELENLKAAAAAPVAEPVAEPAPQPEIQPAPRWEPAPMPDRQQAQPLRPGEYKFCIYCGSPLEPGDIFCSNCGRRLG